MKFVDIPIAIVAERCGIWMKHSGGGSEIRCRCPFCCGQNKPTASINTSKNVFYCFKCGESHNSITLYSKLSGASTKEAYRELAEILNNAA